MHRSQPRRKDVVLERVSRVPRLRLRRIVDFQYVTLLHLQIPALAPRLRGVAFVAVVVLSHHEPLELVAAHHRINPALVDHRHVGVPVEGQVHGESLA